MSLPTRARTANRSRAGSTTLTALHTPGHAPDHFCFLDVATGDVYCGDLARRGGTIVVPASAGGDLAQYLASLRRIRALQPRRLLPGHGPIVLDPAALIDDYLQHRAEREAQVLDAAATGPDHRRRDRPAHLHAAASVGGASRRRQRARPPDQAARRGESRGRERGMACEVTDRFGVRGVADWGRLASDSVDR